MIRPEDYAKESESSQQIALFIWSALPEVRAKYPELKWLFHIPNGGSRNNIEAARLKAQGVKAGVPDLMLPVKRSLGYGGLFIELKKMKGIVSQKQKYWLDYLHCYGEYFATVCYGWEQARDVIIWYLELPK